MSFNTLINSENSDVFFVERISNEPSAQRNNSPNILNSTEISHTHTARMPSVSPIASPETQILTIHDDTNEPTMPNGLGRQLPIVPTSLNDLNLPPNPFHILATMVVVNHTAHGKEDIYSPQSPEPYELSLISTAPKNVSTFDNWETSHTTTDDNNFYSDDEPVRIYFLPSTPTPPPPPRKMKKKWNWECRFQEKGECRSTSAKSADRRFPQQRTSQVHQTTTRTLKDTQTLSRTIELMISLNASCIH